MNNIWCISDSFAPLLEFQLVRILQADNPLQKQIRLVMNEAAKPVMTEDGIAQISISGPLANRPDAWEMLLDGVNDSEQLANLITQQANSSQVKGILLDVNSPGGSTNGGPELADAVAYAASKKPTVAWTGGSMCSLAYMLSAPASEIIASQSADVGSIGTYAVFADYSAMLDKAGIKLEVIRNTDGVFKAIGIPGTSLSESQRNHLQQRVDSIHANFAKTVTQSRPSVKSESMRGQVFTGSEAKDAGLVDRIGGREFALSVIRSLASKGKTK